MGKEVSRIEGEFVMNALVDNEIPVKIHCGRLVVSGKVDSVDEGTLTILVPENLPEKELVSVFFSFFGQVMHFETSVVSCEDRLVVRSPERIYKNLERKYERVTPPNETRVVFTLEGEVIDLEFPVTEAYNDSVVPNDFLFADSSDLPDLVKQFYSRFSGFDHTSIVMFRNQNPKWPYEFLVAESGRLLVLMAGEKTFPSEKRYVGVPVISHEYMAGFESGNPDLADVDYASLQTQVTFAEAAIICPIIYREYCIGYATVAGNLGHPLRDDDVEWIYQFSLVLANALENNGYFSGGGVRSEEIVPRILDISASGVLVAALPSHLVANLSLYSDLEITVETNDRSLEIQCRVMRSFVAKNQQYFALQYINIRPEDFRFLFQWIYGRPITADDQNLWEGGASPPPLVLD
jgi:hypothetical protein